MNEMIISAKCHAIRQAQIVEKQIIKSELAQEEARLDQVSSLSIFVSFPEQKLLLPIVVILQLCRFVCICRVADGN